MHYLHQEYVHIQTATQLCHFPICGTFIEDYVTVCLLQISLPLVSLARFDIVHPLIIILVAL